MLLRCHAVLRRARVGSAAVTRALSRAAFSTVSPAAAQPEPRVRPELSAAQQLLDLFRRDAAADLPARLLSAPSASLLSAELRHVHGSHPVFACLAQQLPGSGDYLTVELGDVSVIVVRGSDGSVRAFFNNCSHQNARIAASSRPDLAAIARTADIRQAAAEAAVGSARPPPCLAAGPAVLQRGPECSRVQRFVCPFHHWTFSLAGEHLAPRTPLTADPEQRKHFALRAAAAVRQQGDVLWLTCSSAAFPAAEQEAQAEAERRAVSEAVLGCSAACVGSRVLVADWKAVWSRAASWPSCLPAFPSLLCRLLPGRPAQLLHIVPLTPQLTAVTLYRLTQGRPAEGGQADEREADACWAWLAAATADGSVAGSWLPRYAAWMEAGLAAAVEAEERQRRELHARRDRLLAAG